MGHSIGYGSRVVGKSANAIRRYERLGLIKLSRDERGWRDLTDADIAKLREIAASRPNGRPPRGREGSPR
jgi:DNA-binding transcriptional MerR regulator